MGTLARLNEHLARREWVLLKREARRLTIFSRLSPRDKARVYRAWGRALAGLDDTHGAIKQLEKSLPYALKAKDWDCLGLARVDLGALHAMVGDNEAGLRYSLAYLLDFDRYDEARKFYGRVRLNLGLAYKYLKRYGEAIQHYEAAIDWCTLRGLDRDKALAHQNLAWLFCKVGRLDEARTQLEVADTYRERLGDEFDAEQICCWAYYYLKTKQIGAAVDCTQEILLAKRPGVNAHHKGQVAVIAGEIAVFMDQQKTAQQLLALAQDAAVETEDPELGKECDSLEAKIAAKWSENQEAAT